MHVCLIPTSLFWYVFILVRAFGFFASFLCDIFLASSRASNLTHFQDVLSTSFQLSFFLEILDF